MSEEVLKGWRVAWLAEGGVSGGGTQPLDFDVARAWRDYGNKEYPFIRHWIEPWREKNEEQMSQETKPKAELVEGWAMPETFNES